MEVSDEMKQVWEREKRNKRWEDSQKTDRKGQTAENQKKTIAAVQSRDRTFSEQMQN